MPVTLEQIEMLRARANVSYAEAKEVLEKCNGDVLEALISLETQARLKAPKTDDSESGCCKTSKSFMKTVKKLIKKGNETKFVIRKAESTVIDIPVSILVIITVIMPPLTVAAILLAMITNHKLSFVKPDGEGLKINNTLDKVSSCVTSVSNKVTEAINEVK